MATDKKAFVLYSDLIGNIDHLTNEEKGILFTHLLEYVNDLNPVLEDRLILTAWKPIQRQLERDLEKYKAKKLQWSEAGKRSAEVRKANKNERTLTDVEERSTDLTVKDTVSVKDTVKDTVIVKDNKRESKEKTARFVSPTIDEIFIYINQEKGKEKSFAKKESEKMFNFYESKGWLVGKAKMKNWKAAASNWIARAETDFATKDKPAFKLNTNRPT